MVLGGWVVLVDVEEVTLLVDLTTCSFRTTAAPLTGAVPPMACEDVGAGAAVEYVDETAADWRESVFPGPGVGEGRGNVLVNERGLVVGVLSTSPAPVSSRVTTDTPLRGVDEGLELDLLDSFALSVSSPALEGD